MGHHVARNVKNTHATATWIVVLEHPATGDSIRLLQKKGTFGPAVGPQPVDGKEIDALEIAPIFDNETYELVQVRGKLEHKVAGNIVVKHMVLKTPGPPPTTAPEADPKEVQTDLRRLDPPQASDDVLAQETTKFEQVKLEELKGG